MVSTAPQRAANRGYWRDKFGYHLQGGIQYSQTNLETAMDYPVKFSAEKFGDTPLLSTVADAIVNRLTTGGMPNGYNQEDHEQIRERIYIRLWKAVASRKLKTCDQFGDDAPPIYTHYPSYSDLVTRYVKKKHLVDWGALDGDTFTFQDTDHDAILVEKVLPVELEYQVTETLSDQSNVVMLGSEGPTPLTSGDIAHCFNGLRWSESGWKKPLGDKPKWLAASVLIPGRRGVNETRWNPVLIAAALVKRKDATPRQVRVKFQTIDLLKPWLDAWKTYEADYCDNV